MVLDYDYSVNSVRVTRPETEVRNVRAAVGKVACSGHISPTLGLGQSHSVAYSGIVVFFIVLYNSTVDQKFRTPYFSTFLE